MRSFLRWKPFSITSFEMARTLKAQALTFGTVLDGGANIGQFARAMAETFPGARVYSFEPLPEIAARFQSNLANCGRVHFHACALGAETGTLTFYRHPYSLASSALRPTDGTAVEELRVPVRRLDDVLAPETLPGPVLLKLDLQGFELEALRGATETLKRVDYVLLETAFREAYQGEPPFESLQAYLAEHGFRFLRPIDFLKDGKGEIIQMDALFGRSDA